MATFTALNVYPDSDSDSEVDNTQEIQIEEALKIYQRALKAHSEKNWEEGEAAYVELFKSEIFEHANDSLDEEITATSSSIHSVLYLAFKNHAAFLLDRLKTQPSIDLEDPITRKSFERTVIWFAEALARDPGDPSLWQNASELSKVYNSTRLRRFCLESILDRDATVREPTEVFSITRSGQGPVEFVSSLQLRDVLLVLTDDTSLSSNLFQKLKKKKAQPALTKNLIPYPWLKAKFKARRHEELINTLTYDPVLAPEKHIMHVQSRTWSAVGKVLLKRRLMVDDKSTSSLSSYVQIDIPPSRDDSPDSEVLPETSPESDQAIVGDGDITMGDSAPTLTVENRRDSSHRKRKSASLAGNDEPNRSRLSKRVRERESNAHAAAAVVVTPPIRQVISQDEKLFTTAEACFTLFSVSLGRASSLKFRAGGEDDDEIATNDLYLRDFKNILRDWDDDKGNVLIYGEGIQTPDEASPGMAFLDMEATNSSNIYFPTLTDEGLRRWLRKFDKSCIHVKELCFEWLKALMMRDWVEPNLGKKTSNTALAKKGRASWMRHSWPEPLRDVVNAMVGDLEEGLWNYFKKWEARFMERVEEEGECMFGDHDYAIVEWAQTVLEIFLGDLAASDKERSAVDTEEMHEKWEFTKNRCRRWSYLVGDLIHCRPRNSQGQVSEDQLTFRYLWVNAELAGFTDSTREFVLECFEDLKKLLKDSDNQIILPNSAVMPEISASRAEREISKLKTMDFFTSIFQATTQMADPAEVIVNLEAVLNPQSISDREDVDEQQIQEMARFLEGSSSQFKLYLWERLREAYEHKDINFPIRVLACRLRCLDLIMNDFRSSSYLESSEDHRQFVLLRALRQLENILPAALEIALKSRENLAIGVDSLSNSMRSLALLLRLLHTYSFYEDGVMNSEFTASDLHSYRLVVVKFREMLVRAWCLMYLLYREVVENTNQDLGEEPHQLLGSLLRDIHDELGVRHYCKLSNRQFLKLMQSELLRFSDSNFDEELVQCLSCRFHLKLGTDEWELYEHRTEPETLDKRNALEILDFVLLLAQRKKIQQLPKADIRSALDKILEVIGVPKKTTKYQYNENIIEEYLASSLNPLKMFRSLRGQGFLSTVPIAGDFAYVAKKGLYFLRGHIHLSLIRDRSIKNRVQVKGDDLDTALRYFKYTLVCHPEDWEAWYRLAQTYGTQVDEDMTWTADAINNHRKELVRKERRCILSFIMALACAIRTADDTTETRKKISTLYYDFGHRIYSSARPPMSMESWWMDDFPRHFSGTSGQGMYKKPAHKEVSGTDALRFAAKLFDKSLEDVPKDWKRHYMLGKCMGKLEKVEELKLYTPEDVLDRFSIAVRCAPEKAGSDLLMEPHHKIVSATCKYVLSGKLTPQRAYEILEVTSYSKGLKKAEDRESFGTYILAVLQKMRTADKQKWHHRMTIRIARFEQQERKDMTAAVKEVGSLFSSKAAVLSIWRPENERPGRHFVFASAYTLLYVELLEAVGDRTTLEAVAKRVRKHSTGLYQHINVVWDTTYKSYARVLRKAGSVPHLFEEKIFSTVSFDEFNTFSQRLEVYCNREVLPKHQPILDIFREVLELRRLNLGMGKTVELDDLLADTYAKVYYDLVPEILYTEADLSADTAMLGTEAHLTITTSTTNTPSNSNPMSLKNLIFEEAAAAAAAALQNNHPTSVTSSAASPSSNTTTTATAVSIAAAHSKMEDLPLRGKMTKVTRRDVISKAGNLFKAPAPAPAGSASASAVAASKSVSAVPSPKLAGMSLPRRGGGGGRGGDKEMEQEQGQVGGGGGDQWDTPMGSPPPEENGNEGDGDEEGEGQSADDEGEGGDDAMDGGDETEEGDGEEEAGEESMMEIE